MRTLLYIASIVLVLTSCKEIIAEDITGKMPVLILPTVNDTVETSLVHFKWDELDGASSYKLMVVSPSFASISSYELDSIVTGTNFYYSLDSNDYEVKLVALNAGYSSDTLDPIPFVVGVQSNSSSGNVVLSSPANGVYESATFDKVFQWNSLTDATSYEISIREGSSFATGTQIDFGNNISSPSFTSTRSFPEGEYYWGVKAYLQSGGETLYTTHTLYIDTNAPNEPVLGAPTHLSSEFAGTINFTWNNGTDPGIITSPVTSLLEISSDTGFATIVDSQSVQGSSADVALTNGVYYWRVTNTDAAGNVSAPAVYNQLTIN